MKSTRKSAAPAGKNASPAAALESGKARLPAILALVWTASIVAALLLSGCPRFTVYYAVYALATLGLAAGELVFLDAIYRRGRPELFSAFKKFTGYGLVVHYVACSLPRVDWSNLLLIGSGRVVFLFSLSVVSLAIGLALFFSASRPSVYAALGLITREELEDRSLRRAHRNAKKKGPLGIILEWVDALAFAAIAVILVNIFIFQLYVVPSESMVPVFLSGDRPFTAKFLAGPRIPLTDWRLPFARLPKRGDVVTIANPRYPENHHVDLKKYLSQLVSMVTFTAVNIDKLPDGSPKADPLVKRIVGVPGEKLMMVDDVLYAKRAGDSGFAPVAADRAYSQVDLWKLPDAERAHIATIPIDQSIRTMLTAIDRRKNAADPAALGAALAATVSRIETELARDRPGVASFEARQLPRLNQLVVSARDSLVSGAQAGDQGGNALSRMGVGERDEDLPLTLALARSGRLRTELAAYGATPPALASGADAYTRGTRVFDLLIKTNLLARIERDLQLMASGATIENFLADKERSALETEAGDLLTYLRLYDFRNFPEFPAGSGYLGPHQYFAMGDNRYNSLDFRFKHERPGIRSLDGTDPSSILYVSNLEPFALDRRFIEGYALFRIWPPSRIGAIK
ncbi:MAG: signal peptidase I [Treponema sp.]|nr:signal peptidase I [Treponema sp.]